MSAALTLTFDDETLGRLTRAAAERDMSAEAVAAMAVKVFLADQDFDYELDDHALEQIRIGLAEAQRGRSPPMRRWSARSTDTVRHEAYLDATLYQQSARNWRACRARPARRRCPASASQGARDNADRFAIPGSARSLA